MWIVFAAVGIHLGLVLIAFRRENDMLQALMREYLKLEKHSGDEYERYLHKAAWRMLIWDVARGVDVFKWFAKRDERLPDYDLVRTEFWSFICDEIQRVF